MLTPKQKQANNIRPFQSLAIGEHFSVNPGTTPRTQRIFEKIDNVTIVRGLHQPFTANARDDRGGLARFQNEHMVTVVSRE
jgi:hypothetical protein